MTSTVPEPQTVLEEYTPLLQLIVSALQSGTTHAQSYADWQDEKVDRALAAALVRKGAKRFLLANAQDVQNEEDEQPLEYEAEYLSNLGLAMNAGTVRIRVLRSDNGNMPVPGHSKRRQKFYAQQSLLPFDPADLEATDELAPSILNLVLHWTTDSEYHLDKVFLGCPKAGGLTRASVEAHWDELIWRRYDPALSGTTAQAQADVADLDIYLDSEATGTGA